MRRLVPIASLYAALAAAACGRAPEVDENLKRDLDAAAASTIELAPAGPRTSVISAIESKQPVQPRVTPVRQTIAPAKTPPPVTPQAAQTKEPAATRPTSRPAVQPPPPGGYKTVDEVIRNAPFPIKPATKRP
ncbi:MAG: hypothetical protein ACRENU_10195 [Gemmatimonadaceae bacterium]